MPLPCCLAGLGCGRSVDPPARRAASPPSQPWRTAHRRSTRCTVAKAFSSVSGLKPAVRAYVRSASESRWRPKRLQEETSWQAHSKLSHDKSDAPRRSLLVYVLPRHIDRVPRLTEGKDDRECTPLTAAGWLAERSLTTAAYPVPAIYSRATRVTRSRLGHFLYPAFGTTPVRGTRLR
jgi:hypothetical protein